MDKRGNMGLRVRARGERWEERKNGRKPLPNNVRFFGTFCGSLVLTHYGGKRY